MRTAPAAALFVLVSCVAARPARATEGCVCPIETDTVLTVPAWTPTNARWLIPAGSEQKVSLTSRLDGTQVELTTEPGPVPSYVWLRPSTPLPPDTSLAVVAPFHTAGLLQTGVGPDDAPPMVTAVSTMPSGLFGACKSHNAATIVVQGEDEGSGIIATLAEVDTGRERVEIVLAGLEGVVGEMLDEDWRDCLGNLAGAEAEQDYTLRVRAVDAAGNISQYSDPITFQLGYQPGCLCSDSQVGAGAGFAPLVLAGLLLLRPRRRTGGN